MNHPSRNRSDTSDLASQPRENNSDASVEPITNTWEAGVLAKSLPQFKYFTDLAPEIRNQVYELLLTEDYEIVFDTRQTPIADLANLSLTSKSIGSEARSMYFSINRFRLQSFYKDINISSTFLQRIPLKCVAHIKHLTINTFIGVVGVTQHDSGSDNFRFDLGKQQLQNLTRTFSMIKKFFPGLESLTVEFGKVSFVPFLVSADEEVFGQNAKKFANLSLLPLYSLPKFKQLVLVQKQDLNMESLVEKVLKTTGEWKGEVKRVQG
ncbi:hypothetical protein EG329_012891 [Mollisiaceae sp. DMI_Dod_QoI]|nr:hypothetical protein EG329_012891 [Helotiales sp. DMI_Dod_QoI]